MGILSVGSVENAANGEAVTWNEIVARESYYTDISVTVPSLATNRAVALFFLQHTAEINFVSISSIVWDYGGADQTMSLGTEATVSRLCVQAGYLVTADSPTQNATITVRVTAAFADLPSGNLTHVVSCWATADNALVYDTEASGTGTTSGSNPYYYTVTTSVGAAGVLISATASESNAVSDPFPDGTELQEADSGGNCSIVGYTTPASSGSVNHRHGYSQNNQNTAGISVSFIEGGTPPAAPEIPHPGYPDALPRRPRLAFPTGLTGIKAEADAQRLLRRQRDWLKVAA